MVDLISTTFGAKPPAVPLKEERLTLGVECVYRAKGVGWNGVKKNRKKYRRQKQAMQRKQLIPLPPLCIKNCGPFDDLFGDDDQTPKVLNTRTQQINESTSKALSYEEYLEYLHRSNAKRNEKIEYPYLELETTQGSFEGETTLKRRMFTKELEANDKSDSSADAENQLSRSTQGVRQNHSSPPVSTSVPALTSPQELAPSTKERQNKDDGNDEKYEKPASTGREFDQESLKKEDAPVVNEDGKIYGKHADAVIDNLIKSSVAIEKNTVVPICAAVTDTTIRRTDPIVFVQKMEEKKLESPEIPNVVKKESKVLSQSRTMSIMDSVSAGGSMIPVRPDVMAPTDSNDARNDQSSVTKSIDSNNDRRDDILQEEVDDLKLSEAPTPTIENLRYASTEEEEDTQDLPVLLKRRSKLFSRQSSREISRAIMKEHGFSDILPPSSDSEAPIFSSASTNDEDTDDSVTHDEQQKTEAAPSSPSLQEEQNNDTLIAPPTPTKDEDKDDSVTPDEEQKTEVATSSPSPPSLQDVQDNDTPIMAPSASADDEDKNEEVQETEVSLSSPSSPSLQEEQDNDAPMAPLASTEDKDDSVTHEDENQMEAAPSSPALQEEQHNDAPMAPPASTNDEDKDDSVTHDDENQMEAAPSSPSPPSLQEEQNNDTPMAPPASTNDEDKDDGVTQEEDEASPSSPSPPQEEQDNDLPMAPLSPTNDGDKDNTVKHEEEKTAKVESSSSSVISHTSLPLSESASVMSTSEEPQIEYQIPESFSMNSCNSSMYSAEVNSALQSEKEEIKSVDSHSTFGLGDVNLKSFSFPSVKGSFSFKSERSAMTTESVEHTISYTISELGRIHSMMDENNMEEMSCNSESTAGHDVLYFAKQSKSEIAALANLIQRQINDEKNAGSFDLPSPSKSVSGLSIVQSNSYDTMKSGLSISKMKSLGSSPSMDRLIHEVNDLCSQIEDRIDNIVLDTVREDSPRE